MIKRLILSTVAIIIFCTSFIFPVSALEDGWIDENIYTGTFLGEEYPIIPINPDVSLLYNVDGFSVSAYYYNGGWSSFNQALTVPDTSERKFKFSISLPEAIEHGSTFSLNLNLLHSGLISSRMSEVLCYDSSGNQSYKGSGSVSYSSYNVTVNCGSLTAESGSVKKIDVILFAKPSATNVSFYVTGVTVEKSALNVGALTSAMTFMSDILEIINLNLNELGVNVTAIRDYSVSLIENLNSGLSVVTESIVDYGSVLNNSIIDLRSQLLDKLNLINTNLVNYGDSVKTKLDNLQTSITSYFTQLFNKLQIHFNSLEEMLLLKTNQIIDRLDGLLNYFKGESTKDDVDANNAANEQLNEVIQGSNQIESSLNQGFNSSFNSIPQFNPMELFNDSTLGFAYSAAVLKDGLQTLLQLHSGIYTMVFYSLILGLAFTVLGISTKRR